MTPGQAAYDAWRKVMGLDAIQPHGLAKEAPGPYNVSFSSLPVFAQRAWEAAAQAARENKV